MAILIQAMTLCVLWGEEGCVRRRGGCEAGVTDIWTIVSHAPLAVVCVLCLSSGRLSFLTPTCVVWQWCVVCVCVCRGEKPLQWNMWPGNSSGYCACKLSTKWDLNVYGWGRKHTQLTPTAPASLFQSNLKQWALREKAACDTLVSYSLTMKERALFCQ